MRHLFLFGGALLLAAFALACQQTGTTANGNAAQTTTAGAPQTAAPPTTNADGVRRVSPQEANNLAAQGKAVIIDSRSLDAYKTGHVKGSTNMPLDMTFADKAAASLPKDKLIIFYCS